MLAGEEVAQREVVVEVLWPNTRLNIEVTKPQTFNGEANKMFGFLIAYRLYIRIRMREVWVKKISIVDTVIYARQISRHLEKNVMEDLEKELLN